jgi:hypothetical protein
MMGIFDDILACYGEYHDYIQLSIVLLVFSAYFGLFIIISGGVLVSSIHL